jgi:hypothetical protein
MVLGIAQFILFHELFCVKVKYPTLIRRILTQWSVLSVDYLRRNFFIIINKLEAYHGK